MTTLKIELHCHTCYSKDCLMTPEKLLEQCQRKGVDRVAITDHNVIEGAVRAAALDPERVIVGEEIMTTHGELLGYFMKERVPSGLTPQETISRLRSQGALISVAHPFDDLRGGAWKEEDLMEILELVDALEIFNARSFSSAANHRAAILAKQKGLLGTVGSDAHAACEIGRATLSIPAFRDMDGLRSALKTAQINAHRSTPLVHFLSRYASFRKALGWKP